MRLNIRQLAASVSSGSSASFEDFCDKPGDLIALESLADALSNISMGIEDFSPVGTLAKSFYWSTPSMEDGKKIAIVAAILAAVAGLLTWVYKKLRGDKDVNSSLSRIAADCDAASKGADGASSKSEEEIAKATEGAEVSVLVADPDVAAAAGKVGVPDVAALSAITDKMHALAKAASSDANSEAATKALADLEAELNQRKDTQTDALEGLAKSLGVDVHIDPSKPESFSAAVTAINGALRGNKKAINSKVIRDLKNGGANLKHNLDQVNQKVADLNKAADAIGRLSEAQTKIAAEMEKVQGGNVIVSTLRAASNRIRSAMAGVMLVTSISGTTATDSKKVVAAASK